MNYGTPSKKGYFPVPDHIFQDLRWWDTIMPILIGTMSIYLDIFFKPGALIDTDATLVEAGGVCKGHYFHAQFPQVITHEAHIIALLELLAFILALKAWPHLVANTKFVESLGPQGLRDLTCTQKLTITFIKDEWFEFSHNW